jgi:para-aminobenzoate synthetase component 1
MQFQAHIQVSDSLATKHNLVGFFKKSSTLLLLDGNSSESNSFDWMLAVGAVDAVSVDTENAFEELQFFYDKHKDWVFGSLSYDLKNGLENLQSTHSDSIQFPALHFFLPEYLFIYQNEKLEIYKHTSVSEFDLSILKSPIEFSEIAITQVLKNRVSKNKYITNVNLVKDHIQRGDIYEMNYCQEFYAEKTEFNPFETFTRLNAISKAPFSCYYKVGDTYLLSASPERYLKKTGSKILSQPIKGTRKRGKTTTEDEALKKELYEDQKERSENVMIVDLVRNDLSKIAKINSVTVEELFGIYTFDQVHQMISTISCEVEEQTSLKEILEATFPMGSMTGAPKISAMKLIEKFEETKRGLYSGAVGYISPTGDFDFNVVIRSIQYNALNKYLSFMVGGAITIGSDAELEYQECLVKAKALFEVLDQNHAETVS